MGEVFEAEDLRLHRKVALKILPEIWVRDSDQGRRFEREAQTLAALDHPNIVTIYSVEEADDRFFLTMELVSGEPLSKRIPEGGLPLREFFSLALQITDALMAAHERNVVHRDIKCGNIMVSDEGRVKVLDFGLAKRRHPSDDEIQDSQTLTRDGMMLGTLPYMSPEQVQGGAVDHRTDIFSLGIVLYEMAAGRRPFAGSSWGDLASAILRDDPPSVTEHNVRLPRHLARILRHCLEKDVKRRFQTVADLHNELDDLRREMSAADTGGTASGHLWSPQMLDSPEPWWRRRPWVPPWRANRRRRASFGRRSAGRANGLRIGALLAFLGLLVGTSWLWQSGEITRLIGGGEAGPGTTEIRQQLRTVVLPFENLGPSEVAYFADGITEEITSRLATVSALTVISRRTLGDGALRDADFALEGTVRWDPRASGDGATRVRVTVRLVKVDDGTQMWSESYERVIDDIFAVQTEIAIEVIRQMDIVLLEPERRAMEARPTDNLEAFRAYLQGMDLAGRRDPSSSQWQRAVERFERAVTLDPEFALAWAELSEVESLVYHLHIDHTSERLARARRAVDRALAIDPELPQAQRALAYYYYWGHRDFAQALAAFEKAAERLPSDGQVLGGMAYIWRRQGHFDRAAEQLRRALDYDPDSAWLAAELARTHRMMRQYREADRYYARAIELQPDQPGPYRERATNYLLWHGGLDSALATLDIMPRPQSTVSLLARYSLELMSGNFDLAKAALDSTTVSRVNTDAETLPKTFLEGRIVFVQSGPEQARPFFASAARELEGLLRGTAEDTRVLTVLARSRAHLGDTEGALEAISRANLLAPVESDAIVGNQVRLITARVHATLGQAEEAVAILEEQLAARAEISIPMLRIDPTWDPIRQHPAFQRLIDDQKPLTVAIPND